MTSTSREILEKYQIRKTKKQKQAFRDYVQGLCNEWGYPCRVEKGAFGVRNIVVGDPAAAKVVYGAHYDTCAVLPFPNFITPKHFGIYLAYQLGVIAVLLVLMFAVSFVCAAAVQLLTADQGVAGAVTGVASQLVWLAFLLLLLGGPANKHTANDNTSGVTVLLDTMAALPEEKRAQAAFVFFDLEESGLFGSSAFAAKHKKVMKNKPLINFDCVSDGENMIFALRPRAKQLAPVLAQAFPSTDAVKTEILTKGVFYPSDQASFRQGVGVAALLKSRKGGILYMDKIHTPKDTVYREENIEYLAAGAVRLTELL